MVKRHDNYTYDLKYQAREEQKKRRAKRNKDRLKALKEGKVQKGDEQDVHHLNKDQLSGVKIIDRSRNRSKK